MDKPDLDSIDGLSPAVSIDRRPLPEILALPWVPLREIYDYLRLLYARMGAPHCPECGRVIERQTTDQVADKILEAGQGRKSLRPGSCCFRVARASTSSSLKTCAKKDFLAFVLTALCVKLDEEITLGKTLKHDIEVVVDRIVIRPDSLGHYC